MNKVIAYSLYGDDDLYCLGMLENIDIINEFYRDWKVYVYYYNIPDTILGELRSKPNTFLFPCQHGGAKWEGMFWRFYPLEDKTIDVFLSRDADSRISQREMSLVNHFLQSDKVFHIIRDNPVHGVYILGGTFGVKVKEFHKWAKKKGITLPPINSFVNQFHTFVDKNKDRGPDQDFLAASIFPIVHDNNITHISFENLRCSTNDILIPADDNYVGKIIQPQRR